jgi:RNA polymerase sigma-70 factor (ECF subfamily)
MPDEPAAPDTPADGPGQFASTQWTLIARARDPDAREAREALAALCRTYWYPLYAYVRRKARAGEDALDLTQGFFAHLLGKNALTAADRARGKFRTFLRACCDHYLANQRDAARARKRGGGRPPLSLDRRSAEERYRPEPAGSATPQELFERDWALALLEATFLLLQREYEQADRSALYGLLRPALTADPDAPSYADLAARLGMTEGAVKKAAQRLRARYGELLRQQLAATVDGPEQVEEELRSLFTALAR